MSNAASLAQNNPQLLADIVEGLPLTVQLPPDQLEEALRAIGAARYHRNHPYHARMYQGKLDLPQLQAWALNRYYYQVMIPIKDSYTMARLPTSELRREWIRRITDHDGTDEKGGGIERWLKLTDGLGLDRDYVISTRGILPATRFSVEAYVHYVQERSLLATIAASLTELFSPAIIPERMSGMLQHYDFISDHTLAYFKPRLTQAPQDSAFALAYVKEHAKTAEQQEDVLAALRFKCDVLWTLLDALEYAYGLDVPHIPPGAFRPKK
ncbi:pyrroloquinoline quinone biosynthesis protein [Lasius niger]|uniref:Pyrroloquinoline quinone biosynthesis protein n=1 Tax=Lasius niger TaxID=67767 RepID=A0A0J7KKG1_LASNI|nr:pyrroloquinoline quinone biosynthesis protein [Lasius niger]